MKYGGVHIWIVLEVFSRATDELLDCLRIDHLVDIGPLLGLVGASSIDDLVLGGWRVEGPAARWLESELGFPMKDVENEIFVAAVQAVTSDEALTESGVESELRRSTLPRE